MRQAFTFIGLLGILLASNSRAAEFQIDLAHPIPNAPKEAVLFPFDTYAIPFRKGLEMTLLRSEHTRAPYNPVIVRGNPGAPDSARIGYYGTVIEKDGRFHMWYIGDGDKDHVDQEKSTAYLHLCYATSDDGFHWTKPNLGLVDHHGSKENNLVQTNIDSIYRACTVLYEPDDPDPDRRFKLFWEGNGQYSHVAFSKDGLVWNPSKANPVSSVPFEQSGIVHRDGMYYVAGQVPEDFGGSTHRLVVEMLSPDFEHWTDPVGWAFRRDPLPPRNVYWRFNNGPQAHLGAGFWDRGNVLIGLYGQWDGDPTDIDRRYMKMNLGMIITHDGLHFTEPTPDFKMINSDEENWSLESMGSPPRLSQGQGFVNHGEQTMTYFGHWGKDGNKEIRVAVWARDRLGQYAVNRKPIEGQYPATRPAIDEPDPTQKLPYLMSCPIVLPEGGGQVFLNCGNLSKHSDLRVAVVDRNFKPVEGYSLGDCEPVQSDGFKVPVRWKQGDRLRAKGPVRLRIQWGGVRFEDPIVYAVYVTP
jgi:hypothetical protein